MSNCPTCNKSILSQTPFKIGETQCTQPCPPETPCTDGFIASNCVYYSGSQLICPSGNTSVDYGDTLTVALGKMHDLICQNSTSNTVQVTANDTCYGYLASKITSSSLNITISDPGRCEKLNIEEKCCTWTAANLLNGFVNFPSGQPVEYSSIKGCSVKLRGRFSRTTLTSGTHLIFKLPLNRAPLNPRVFSVLTTSSVLPTGLAFVTVQTNGDVSLSYSPLASGSVIVSLDGIEFEIN